MVLSEKRNDDRVDRILHVHNRDGSAAMMESVRRRRPQAGGKDGALDPLSSSQVLAGKQGANDRVRRIMANRLSEVKAREREQQEREAQDEDNKRRVLLNLKRNIDHVSEEDRRKAIEARKQRERTEKGRREEKQQLLQQGQNPEEVFRRRKLEAAKTKKRKQLKKQREKQEQEIAARLAKEMAAQRADVESKTARLRQTALGGTVHAMQQTGAAVMGKFEAEAALQLKQEKAQRHTAKHGAAKQGAAAK